MPKNLTLETFQIDEISDLADSGERQFVSAKVFVSFVDDRINYRPGVTVRVAALCGYESSLDAIRAAALKSAAEVLAEACRLVEQHDLQRLQQLSDEHRDRTTAAAMPPSLEDPA